MSKRFDSRKRRMKPGLARFLGEKDSLSQPHRASRRPLIGVLPGTGIGPSVVSAALQTLKSVEQVFGFRCEVREGGLIGEAAVSDCGQWLPDETAEFCADVFRRGGAILSGPGGGRYVYDLRRRFDLFCKFVPIRPVPELQGACRLSPKHLRDVDILLVRDNIAGVYQGCWGEQVTESGRIAEHTFRYDETQVGRIVEVAARAAKQRRGDLCVIVKDGGVPTVSSLWRDAGQSAARRHLVEARFMNIDLAAYELVQNPANFDVIAAPNLFGDILADIAGVLVASRGITFSGNFDPLGHGVYQTNHGCAHDLAGSNTANPAGQIFSLAMMLRESFGLAPVAALIESSVAAVWRKGFRTADLMEPGCTLLSTQAMADRIAAQVLCSAEADQPA